MGGYSNLGFLDDGLTGDGIGLGLVDTTAGYTGADSLSDPTLTSDVTGSDPALSFSGEGTLTPGADLGVDGLDSASYEAHLALSGVTETPPSSSSDSGFWDSNGAGSADPAPGASSPVAGTDWNLALNSFGKFGASLAGIISGNHVASVGGVPIGARGSVALDANGRPIGRAPFSGSLSANHTTIIVVVMFGLAAFLIFGGKKKVRIP